MKIRFLAYLLMPLFIFTACRNNNGSGITDEEYKNTSDALVGANRILVEKDRARIESFAERKGWEMQESQTGLWSQIYEKGKGPAAQKGMLVTLKYTLSLMDGTVCYSSDSLGYKQFRIGSGGVESGLEEGVLILEEGDRARFILPPHMAHGLTGDGDKIPPRSIIVYDVEVIKLETGTGESDTGRGGNNV